MSINSPNKQTSHLKREILARLIRAYLGDNFEEEVRLIPYKMRPQGSKVPFRCCVHKERAILRDRVIASLGFELINSSELLELVFMMEIPIAIAENIIIIPKCFFTILK